MKVGVFHPRLNTCGGGEWLAINVIDSLRKNGHKVIILTDERINQTKFIRTFGQKLNNDGEIIFPFHFFKRGDLYNLYTDMISCLVLKSKCDVVIDTYSRLVLPGVDVIYMHYPLFNKQGPQQKTFAGLKNTLYLLLYNAYQNKIRKKTSKIIFANSKFTFNAIETNLDLQPQLLYPPLSPFFLQSKDTISNCQKFDQVVTVSRFSSEKNLMIIPHIAKQLENVKFIVIGNLNDDDVYSMLLETIKNCDVQKRVLLMADLPKSRLRQILMNSKIYLHCAKNEHFGISIVEAMASGCLPIVHDSGGPKELVLEKFRYKTIDEAVEKIKQAIAEWSPAVAWEMCNSTLKFSQENFSKNLLNVLYSRRLLQKDGC